MEQCSHIGAKKDGELRFCIDFRKQNAHTKKDTNPLPHIHDAINILCGLCYYTMVDLLSRFWQMPMAEDPKKYTTFTVGMLGFFQCKHMLFSLCNVPAMFQHLMQSCLGEFNFATCHVHLDDVVIFTAMQEEHLNRLRAVLEQFRAHGLKLKPSKCSFFQQEIEYIGHQLLKDGIWSSKGNLRAIVEFVIDGCHRDAGHQGCDMTWTLVEDRFWWSRAHEDVVQAVKNCKRGNTYKGRDTRVPLVSVVATSPLEIVHVDYTSFETTMELNKAPRMENVLVILYHFTRYIRAYVTKDQKAETTVRYLIDGYISMFGCPEKIISDRGCNFTSNLITQLSAQFGMEKATIKPYHAQCNGQVERAHQTLAQMIGKLEPKQKREWPNHLAELMHAYNSTCLAVTGFSPHYLMFGHWTHLPIDYYYPVDQVMRDKTG